MCRSGGQYELGILPRDDTPGELQRLLAWLVCLVRLLGLKQLFFIVHRGRPPILFFLKISLWRYILGSAKAKKALIYPSDEKVNRRPCRGDRIIVLSTTVFTNFPHFMEHNQTASMRVKTAILLTWTIGAYCARALAPTFSWGEPTMAVFRPRSPQIKRCLTLSCGLL